MTPREAAVLLCALGAVAMFGLATVGLFRLPDFYARAHAVSKGDTLGTLFAVVAVGLAGASISEIAKLTFLVAFVFATTPTATHAIVRADSTDADRPSPPEAEDP
ncbi:monovalent cation/H(+) antiporter subunit G [Haloarculaceae archaeon H-GB2-1]|nr:monovalent cation/H(+) antiporter subunit G [Haloarculaceae archaeon H-GB1-1]MEA5386280.1 monovalent cation/H(+) antiporter subunit G [Haloarculaceae archaeon H-GB11]MEA5407783.1 monovalent cation/H(+) antiporter subunit G [Haloarculaceae archaeon H-GB2-1]